MNHNIDIKFKEKILTMRDVHYQHCSIMIRNMVTQLKLSSNQGKEIKMKLILKNYGKC